MGSDLFGNVYWPTDCIYNIEADSGSICKGGADIDHHFTLAGELNVWKQRYKDRVDQAIMGYAADASIRCCIG